MDFMRVIDIIFGVLLIILAIKLFAVIGIFATIAFSCAGLKILLTAAVP